MKKNLNYYFQQPKIHKNFKKIYTLSNVQLYGVIFHIIKNKEIAQDCLQEIYVKIWHNLERYDETKAKPSTWMITIARNHIFDFLRKKQLKTYDEFDLTLLTDKDNKYDEQLFELEQSKQLKKCLKQLKVLTLAYFQGLTYEQIAKQTNTSVSTLKTQVRRSFPQLKKCMEAL
jgi:RNA polymerase sigma-70 factor (ECF subfamily)